MRPTITFTKTRRHVWPNESHCLEAANERELVFPLSELPARCLQAWNDIADNDLVSAVLPDDPDGQGWASPREQFANLLEKSGKGWYDKMSAALDGERSAAWLEQHDWDVFLEELERIEEHMVQDELIEWFVEMNDPASIRDWSIEGGMTRRQLKECGKALNAACDVVESHESPESWNSMQPDALRTLEQADVADLERAAHHCALRDEDADWLSLWARKAFGADRRGKTLKALANPDEPGIAEEE